ncbi:MAG: helix-turn-helix domain-containing protein [Candidatus Dormibacterales bacterium]
MTIAELPLVLTPSDVQRVLRIGRRQTYSLLDSGAIRSVRVGRSIRIPRSNLLAYLSKPEDKSAEPTGNGPADARAGGAADDPATTIR